jgi:hypothetical protein
MVVRRHHDKESWTPPPRRAKLHSLASAGATIATARFVHHSLDHYLEQLEAMVELNASST